MKKFYRGKIVKITAGAIQFVRNNEKRRDFILLTGRNGDIYIPLSAVERALEDQWIADQELRNERRVNAMKCDGCLAPCERCV